MVLHAQSSNWRGCHRSYRSRIAGVHPTLPSVHGPSLIHPNRVVLSTRCVALRLFTDGETDPASSSCQAEDGALTCALATYISKLTTRLCGETSACREFAFSAVCRQVICILFLYYLKYSFERIRVRFHAAFRVSLRFGTLRTLGVSDS